MVSRYLLVTEKATGAVTAAALSKTGCGGLETGVSDVNTGTEDGGVLDNTDVGGAELAADAGAALLAMFATDDDGATPVAGSALRVVFGEDSNREANLSKVASASTASTYEINPWEGAFHDQTFGYWNIT